MVYLRTLSRIYEKNPTQESFKIKSFLAALVTLAALCLQRFFLGGITPKSNIRIL
jgi:hypothetical protein